MLKLLRLFLAPTALFAAMATLTAGPALAYVGPGAGLTAIGTVLALVAALGLAIVGFVWYPLRRLMRGRRTAAAPGVKPEPGESRSEA